MTYRLDTGGLYMTTRLAIVPFSLQGAGYTHHFHENVGVGMDVKVK